MKHLFTVYCKILIGVHILKMFTNKWPTGLVWVKIRVLYTCIILLWLKGPHPRYFFFNNNLKIGQAKRRDSQQGLWYWKTSLYLSLEACSHYKINKLLPNDYGNLAAWLSIHIAFKYHESNALEIMSNFIFLLPQHGYMDHRYYDWEWFSLLN